MEWSSYDEEPLPPPVDDIATFPYLPKQKPRQAQDTSSNLTTFMPWGHVVKHGTRTSNFKAIAEKRRGEHLVKESAKPKFPKFMELPLELREKMYEEALPQLNMVPLRNYRFSNSDLPVFLPLFCFTSKTIFIESVPVYVRSTTFEINSLTAVLWFTKVLEKLPDDKGFKSVKSLNFCSFHWFPGIEATQSADTQFMKRCPSLRRVELTFAVASIVAFVPEGAAWPTGYRSKTVDEIVRFYDLRALLECKMLRLVVLDVIDSRYYGGDCFKDPIEVMRELKQWFVEEFAKQGQEVQGQLFGRRGRYGESEQVEIV